MFPIYYFSFRAKATMWLCNILDLCRERELSSLTYSVLVPQELISINSSGNYDYGGKITVSGSTSLPTRQERTKSLVYNSTLHPIKSYTLPLREYFSF